MVESTRLESERAGNRTVGSNPTLSAIPPRRYFLVVTVLGVCLAQLLALSAVNERPRNQINHEVGLVWSGHNSGLNSIERPPATPTKIIPETLLAVHFNASWGDKTHGPISTPSCTRTVIRNLKNEREVPKESANLVMDSRPGCELCHPYVATNHGRLGLVCSELAAGSSRSGRTRRPV